MNPILLDTGVILRRIDSLDFEDRIYYVPSIALGEFYYLVAKLENSDNEEDRVKASAMSTILAEFVIPDLTLWCDEETAKHYADIKTALRNKDIDVKENSVWILAIAKQWDLVLESDNRYFLADIVQYVTGVAVQAY